MNFYFLGSFGNSVSLTFWRDFLFYQRIIEINKQVYLLTVLGCECYMFPFMVF